MINIEIISCIQKCIISSMISTFSLRNSSIDCHFCAQSDLASIDQIFTIVTTLSKIVDSQPIVPKACQHSNYTKKIWDVRILRICQTIKETFGNCASWDFHQVNGNIKSSNVTCKWWNKPNSFFNNPCKVVSFEVTTPKMESSSIGDA